MKKFVYLLVLILCTVLGLAVEPPVRNTISPVGVIEVKEVEPGIISVVVEYTNEETFIKEKSVYIIADSDTSQEYFKNNLLKKELQKRKEEFVDGSNYELIPDIIEKDKIVEKKHYEKKKDTVELVPTVKIYNIKVGDKVTE